MRITGREEKRVDQEMFERLSEQMDVIAKLLLVQNREAVAAAIEDIATTPERKEMWRLIDGTKSPKTISSALNLSERAVHYFIADGKTTGLIAVSDTGAPRRRLDFVPKEWELYAPRARQRKVRPRASEHDEAQHKPSAGLGRMTNHDETEEGIEARESD